MDDMTSNRKWHEKSVHWDLEKLQIKKLTEPKSKLKNKDRIPAAEIGRAVRAKSSPSTDKPKSKSKEINNHFTFNSVFDSRILFDNTAVPGDILSH